MKSKEVIQLGVAVVILAIAGYFIYTFLVPQKSSASKKPTYEKITPLSADFDQDTLSNLSDSNKYHDYYTDPDLKNGLGNSQPFGTLR